MNRLADMSHFPALVNLGTSMNIVLTLAVTWWIQPRYPHTYAPLLFIALVLALNLLPVVVLHLTLSQHTMYPPIGQMNFVRDQHKFSDWAYFAVSADMAFWILLGWSVFSMSHTVTALFALESVAFLVTFSPVILRSLRPHATNA